jgi:hypothetical protein
MGAINIYKPSIHMGGLSLPRTLWDGASKDQDCLPLSVFFGEKNGFSDNSRKPVDSGGGDLDIRNSRHFLEGNIFLEA